MSITLPKLPEPVNKHGFNCIQTLDQLRARDLEVARLVLEAAADFLKMEGFGGYAIAIRALEVKHG